MHTHAYTRTHTCTYTHAPHTHTCIHIHTHAYTHACTHAHVCISRNWERQTQRPSLNFNSWQEEATPPSSSNIEMLPRDDSAHHFDVISLERQRAGALGTQVMHPWVPPVRNVEESTADGDPWASEKAAVSATLRVPVGADPPPQDEDVYHMVRDTTSLVHKDLTESGEGVEMASISSPLYEHSDDEGDEVTVI